MLPKITEVENISGLEKAIDEGCYDIALNESSAPILTTLIFVISEKLVEAISNLGWIRMERIVQNKKVTCFRAMCDAQSVHLRLNKLFLNPSDTSSQFFEIPAEGE